MTSTASSTHRAPINHYNAKISDVKPPKALASAYYLRPFKPQVGGSIPPGALREGPAHAGLFCTHGPAGRAGNGGGGKGSGKAPPIRGVGGRPWARAAWARLRS
jgi:hypothetical protein